MLTLTGLQNDSRAEKHSSFMQRVGGSKPTLFKEVSFGGPQSISPLSSITLKAKAGAVGGQPD